MTSTPPTPSSPNEDFSTFDYLQLSLNNLYNQIDSLNSKVDSAITSVSSSVKKLENRISDLEKDASENAQNMTIRTLGQRAFQELHTESFAKAKEYATTALEFGSSDLPREAWLYQILARSLLELEQYSEAEEKAKLAMSLGEVGDFRRGLLQLIASEALLHQKKHVEAVQSAKQGIALKDVSLSAYEDLCTLVRKVYVQTNNAKDFNDFIEERVQDSRSNDTLKASLYHYLTDVHLNRDDCASAICTIQAGRDFSMNSSKLAAAFDELEQKTQVIPQGPPRKKSKVK